MYPGSATSGEEVDLQQRIYLLADELEALEDDFGRCGFALHGDEHADVLTLRFTVEADGMIAGAIISMGGSEVRPEIETCVFEVLDLFDAGEIGVSTPVRKTLYFTH